MEVDSSRILYNDNDTDNGKFRFDHVKVEVV